MGKHYTPSSVSGGNQTQTTLNENFTNIETALEDCVSRSGLTPNTLSSEIDLNSQRAINAADAVNLTDLVTLRQLQGAATLPGQAELVTDTFFAVGPHTLATVELAENSTNLLTVDVVLSTLNVGERAAWTLKVVAYRIGNGAANIQGSVGKLFEVESDVLSDATLITSGNDIIVQVTGLAADTGYWTAAINKVESISVI